MTNRVWWTLAALTLALSACQDASIVHGTGPDLVRHNDAPDVALADPPATDQAEQPWTPPQAWSVHIGDDAPEAVRWAADDLVAYFGDMGFDARLVSGAWQPACELGVGHAALLGNGVGSSEMDAGSTDQTFGYRETRCDSGSLVELAGGGLLGRQYAVYDLLHSLGARFFHPEQEFVPPTPAWPKLEMARQHTPDFKVRSVSLHLTHPLDTGDAFRLQDPALAGEVKRFIDWEVKNLASSGRGGVGQGELYEYGIRRGFPREAGFSVHNQQQGGRPIIDPDDPRSWQDQLAAEIDRRMGDDPARFPQLFTFTFSPSEFTEIDDQQVVAELTFIADYFAEHYPDTRLVTINHGTAGDPTPTYGVRYYDLMQFAPANLGVKVHTLMFYDLFRPAPVYGNTDFNYLYDFMVQEYQERPIWHFPESAWWLTFDIAVPLYLPITMEARSVDIQGIKFMLSGKLEGHHVFGTGHEWGYWQNEYCAYKMAADTDLTYRDCLSDIVAPMGDAGPVVENALSHIIDLQVRDIIYGDLMPYLVGTDPETEIARAAGIEFHPLPPTVSEILAWESETTLAWRRHQGAGLLQMAIDYEGVVAQLRQVRDTVPSAALPWFDEILDGIEVTGLRARHALHAYGSLVALRDAQLTGVEGHLETANRELELAKAATTAVLDVVHRREASYRYLPLDRSIGGGPEGTDDDNWTVYSYRYLNRTHWGYYYTRLDGQVEDALLGSSLPAGVVDALVGPGEVLEVRTYDFALASIHIDYGDGQEADGRNETHTYDNPGVYDVQLSATVEGEAWSTSNPVAQLSAKHRSGGGPNVEEPASAGLIGGLLPGIVFGPIDDNRFALGYDVAANGRIAPDQWQTLVPLDAGVGGTAPELQMPIINAGEVVATVGITHVTVEHAGGQTTLEGDLSTSAVVDALVAIGGFDEEGALSIVATTLGYTSETLPETVSFVLSYQPAAD